MRLGRQNRSGGDSDQQGTILNAFEQKRNISNAAEAKTNSDSDSDSDSNFFFNAVPGGFGGEFLKPFDEQP